MTGYVSILGIASILGIVSILSIVSILDITINLDIVTNSSKPREIDARAVLEQKADESKKGGWALSLGGQKALVNLLYVKKEMRLCLN